MTVSILPSGAYQGYVDNVVEGADGATHIALVDFDGSERGIRAVVKLYPKDSMGIYNEIIGYMLASSLKIPQPSRAAVFPIEVAMLHEVPTWMPTEAQYWLAWCTEWIPKKSIKPWFNKIKGIQGKPPDKKTRKAYRRISADLKRWLKAPNTASFDDWVANNDRNMGNLIRMGRGDYRIIDHGRLFNAEPWFMNQVDANQQYQNTLEWLLNFTMEHKDLSGRMREAADEHSGSLNLIWSDIVALIGDDLPDKVLDQIHGFLEQRSMDTYLKLRYVSLI